VLDTAGADKVLRARLARLDDTRPALRSVADVIRSEFRDQYASGQGWPALSAGYARRKARQGRGTRTNVYTGTLEASLTRTGVRYAAETVTREVVEVRSKDPVGNLLTRGTSRMPARDPARIDVRQVARRSREVLLIHLAAGGR
jgi:hypothetical protein